jgi:site-specific DNA recombinase
MTTTTTTGTTPCVIYAAKSTQDRHRSIDTQLEDCRAMAEEQGWTVLEEYYDEGFSAYSGNRGDDLARARAHAAKAAADAGTPCMLVAQAADRFARGAGDRPGAAEHLVEIWHALRRQDVHLRSVEDDNDLRDSASVANLGQRAMMESRRKGRAIKNGMKRRKAKGLHMGGPPKFGFDYVRDEYGRTVPELPYVVVKAEAAVVERIYRQAVAGVSQRQMEQDFDAEGVRAKRGGRMHQGTISSILADPRYMGWMPGPDDELVRALHPAIVSEALWKQAQTVRAAARKSEGGKRGRQTRGRHLLTNGHLRCGRCGGTMRPRFSVRTHNGKDYPYSRYVCVERRRKVDACTMPPIKADVVDDAVLAYFKRIGVDVEATRAEMIAATQHRIIEVQALRQQAEREHMQAADRLARVRRAFQDGHLEAEDWTEQRAELTAEQEAAAARVATLTQKEADVAASGALTDVEEAMLRRLADLRAAVVGDLNEADTLDSLRAALTRLFERFTLREGPVQRQAGSYAIETDTGWWLDPVVRPSVLQGSELAPHPSQPGAFVALPWVTRTPLAFARDSGGNIDGDALAMTSSAPLSKPRRRCSSSMRPLSTSSGSSGSMRLATPSASRTCLSRSRPSRSGRVRSTIARSG